MRTPVRVLVAASWLVLPVAAFAGGNEPPPEVVKVASKYLDAIAGKGDDSGRDLLLGGATMNASIFTLENWKIVENEPVKSEEGDLASAQKMMGDLDKAGRMALTKMMSGGGTDDMEVQELSQDEAVKLMAPTRASAQKFLKAHPVLAYATRVGKEVYWHPKNPMRPLLTKAGGKGKYKIDLYLMKVQTTEGPRSVARVWPLRVLRFKAGSTDTGWRVLPASDWNAE